MSSSRVEKFMQIKYNLVRSFAQVADLPFTVEFTRSFHMLIPVSCNRFFKSHFSAIVCSALLVDPSHLLTESDHFIFNIDDSDCIYQMTLLASRTGRTWLHVAMRQHGYSYGALLRTCLQLGNMILSVCLTEQQIQSFILSRATTDCGFLINGSTDPFQRQQKEIAKLRNTAKRTLDR